jgi:hypothetical protein
MARACLLEGTAPAMKGILAQLDHTTPTGTTIQRTWGGGGGGGGEKVV